MAQKYVKISEGAFKQLLKEVKTAQTLHIVLQTSNLAAGNVSLMVNKSDVGRVQDIFLFIIDKVSGATKKTLDIEIYNGSDFLPFIVSSYTGGGLGASIKGTVNNGSYSYRCELFVNAEGAMNFTAKQLSNYPDLTSVMNDGITYGFKNGKLEKVADAGKDVLNADAVTATSLAIVALNTGELPIDSSTPPEMIEEVRELLGDELFNEFSAKAVQTMELAPVLSDKERVEQAKADYYARKAEMERLVKEMQQQALLEEGKSNLDVEQSKSESI